MPRSPGDYGIETSKLDFNEADFVTKPKPAPKPVFEAPARAIFPEPKIISSPQKKEDNSF